MTAKIRIKARILNLSGNKMLFLTGLLSVVLVLSVNLLPLLFERYLLPLIVAAVGEIGVYINVFMGAVMLFFAVMIYSAVRIGFIRYYLRKAQSGFANRHDIFYYYSPKRIFSAFAFEIRLFFVKLLIFIICESPFALVVGILLFLLKNDLSLSVMLILLCSAAVMLLFGVVYYKYISMSLFLAKYYYASGEYITFKHILSMSQQTMKNNKSIVFKITMGFIGWFLCCIFVVPIPYVFSYYRQSLGVAADILMKK